MFRIHTTLHSEINIQCSNVKYITAVKFGNKNSVALQNVTLIKISKNLETLTAIGLTQNRVI